ncbi:hypothetical protein FQN60_011451, partial [Etheostoma spectabile]
MKSLVSLVLLTCFLLHISAAPIAPSVPNDGCCQGYRRIDIPKAKVKHVAMTPGDCGPKGKAIVVTTEFKKFCLDPEWNKAKDLLAEFQNPSSTASKPQKSEDKQIKKLCRDIKRRSKKTLHLPLRAPTADVSPLVLLLQLLVRPGEGVEDGRGGERHDEDAAQDAGERDHLSGDAARHHVAVAHRRHGDDGPPVGGRDAAEALLRVRGGERRQLALRQVDQGREEGHGDADEEQQQAELPYAALHGQAQRLQAQGVAGQPHHVQDPQRPQQAQDQAQFVQIASASTHDVGVLLRLVPDVEDQGHVEGQDGDGVDDVEGAAGEGHLALGVDEAQQELQREPRHADGLHHEHALTLLGALALQTQRRTVTRRHWATLKPNSQNTDQVWHGADAQADDGDQHHDHREAGEHLPSQTRLGVFHHFSQYPHQFVTALSNFCVAFLQHHPLLPPLLFFALSLCHLLHAGRHAATATALHVARVHAPVVELIVQRHGAQFPKQTQFPRSQEVEDDPEGCRVSVKEVLPARLVVVVAESCDLLGGGAEAQTAQTTLGELLQGAPGKCVAVAPDVDENLQGVVHHIRGLGVTEQLGALEVNTLDGLSLRDLCEEAVEAAVVAADGVGVEVVVGIADDGHAGFRMCDGMDE